MKKILSLITVVALSAFVAFSCSQNNPIAPSTAPSQGKMLFALVAADNITSGQVTVTKGALTHVLPITITDHSGSVTFEHIQVGHWNILVQLFDDDGVEIYTGDGTAIVTKNNTTTVTIRVEHNTGTLIVEVEVPGLMLWNKLGSDMEVQNSEEGVNGTTHGSILYEPGQFGNGAKFNQDGDYIKFMNTENNLCQQRGCIELWVKPDGYSVTDGTPSDADLKWIWVYSEYNFGGGAFSIGFSGGSHGDGMKWLIWDGSNWIGFGDSAFLVPGLDINDGELAHLAFVWSELGISGTADTCRIYFNGNLLASTTNAITIVDNQDEEFRLGNTGVNYGIGTDDFRGILDNLKIWNYPKTDFSDRFVE